MKRIFFLIACCAWLNVSFAQNDSCHLRISLLTCGAGDDLYSVFGHTALRVTDSVAHTDIIYNYGTFDFTDPDFYIKFTKGKLLYFVSIEQYSEFVYEYQLEQRSIVEQLLGLDCAEKQRLASALQTNAKEENKYYFYEFLFDNCSTRVRDMLTSNMDSSVHVKNILPHPVPTFRNMLHECLENGGQYWAELGIDLCLGSLIDRQPTNTEAMFLPDYLEKGFDSAEINSRPVVLSKKIILPIIKKPAEKELFSPVNTTILILLISVLLSFSNKRWAKKTLDIIDVALFFIIGGIGCFLVFMWAGTEHDLTAKNYNLLWAVPLHLFISFFVLRNKEWVRKYFLVSAIWYLLILILWAVIPQGMNTALLPVVILLGFRSFARSRKNIAHDRKDH